MELKWPEVETPLSSDHWEAYKCKGWVYNHRSGAITYLTRRGMSINEGGTPINIHINWGGAVRGIYVYLFGMRLSKFWAA